jgi:N-formylglutamate deformylase
MPEDLAKKKKAAAAWEALPWKVDVGPGTFVGLAVHAGHVIRPDLRTALAIDDATRRREEDPYTDRIAALCGTRIDTFRSRFEVDLNRPAEEAVCVQPADCWNLEVWKPSGGLTQTMYRRSLEEHRRFYEMLGEVLNEIEAREDHFVVLDCHSYNHRRAGPGSPPADPERNPEINIGTGSMNRGYWANVVDTFRTALASADVLGRHLDVRENVNFRGRYLSEYVHSNYPETGCCLAIEVKKFFMDEWTGELDEEVFEALLAAFRTAIEAVKREL